MIVPITSSDGCRTAIATDSASEFLRKTETFFIIYTHFQTTLFRKNNQKSLVDLKTINQSEEFSLICVTKIITIVTRVVIKPKKKKLSRL